MVSSKFTLCIRAGKENINTDALSRSSFLPAPVVGIAKDEVRVSSLNSTIVADVRTQSQASSPDIHKDES